MSLRHARLTMALSLLMLALATVSQAAVLWDQSAIDFGPSAPGIIDARLTGFGGGTYYTVNDVTVPAGGWTINTITEYFSDWAGQNMSTTAPFGSLIVMPKTGSLPSGAPTVTTVGLNWVDTVISGQGVYVMTVSGLNINLAQGDYWIGVAYTQSANTFFGNNLAWAAATHMGNDCATWDGSWANYYAGYDSAFMLEGYAGNPTPARTGTWGTLKALYR